MCHVKGRRWNKFTCVPYAFKGSICWELISSAVSRLFLCRHYLSLPPNTIILLWKLTNRRIKETNAAVWEERLYERRVSFALLCIQNDLTFNSVARKWGKNARWCNNKHSNNCRVVFEAACFSIPLLTNTCWQRFEGGCSSGRDWINMAAALWGTAVNWCVTALTIWRAGK